MTSELNPTAGLGLPRPDAASHRVPSPGHRVLTSYRPADSAARRSSSVAAHLLERWLRCRLARCPTAWEVAVEGRIWTGDALACRDSTESWAEPLFVVRQDHRLEAVEYPLGRLRWHPLGPAGPWPSSLPRASPAPDSLAQGDLSGRVFGIGLGVAVRPRVAPRPWARTPPRRERPGRCRPGRPPAVRFPGAP